MKVLLSLIVMILVLVGKANAGCFIQDTNGNCTQQSQYDTPQVVQQDSNQQDTSQQSNSCEGSTITCADFIQRSKQGGLSVSSTYNAITKEMIYSAYSGGSTQQISVYDTTDQPAVSRSYSSNSSSSSDLGVKVFLIVALVIGLAIWSWILHEHCEMTYNYSPYNLTNWGIMLGATLGAPLLGLSLLPFGGIGIFFFNKTFWLLSFITGTLIVLIRNSKRTSIPIGIFTTITLIPYTVIAFFMLCGMLDGIKNTFASRRN
jgi:hypothetical protein